MGETHPDATLTPSKTRVFERSTATWNTTITRFNLCSYSYAPLILTYGTKNIKGFMTDWVSFTQLYALIIIFLKFCFWTPLPPDWPNPEFCRFGFHNIIRVSLFYDFTFNFLVVKKKMHLWSLTTAKWPNPEICRSTIFS